MNKNPKIENLKPFTKGVDVRRNTAGRPPEMPELKVILSNLLGEESGGITKAESILQALLLKALKGDIRAAELLLDRGYGKAKQFVDLSADVNIPMQAPVINVYTGNAPKFASSEEEIED